jgi:ABC-2 type transport system ATP-binding protein
MKVLSLSTDLSFFEDASDDEYEQLYNEIINIAKEILDTYQQNQESILTEKQKQADAFKKLDNDPTYGKLNRYKDTPVVTISHFKKVFPGFVLDFENNSVELKFGEITGLIGVNATGKSTLFRCIHGEIEHTSGTLDFPYFRNTLLDFNWHSIRSRIAFVPQYLPEWRGSLETNLKYEAAIRGIKPEENHLEFEYIISRLGLEPYLERSWTELSGGYRLRFALAKALIWKPDLLIIDEPLAHLDMHSQTLVLNDLRTLSKNLRYPISVLISSHHIFELEKVADKILYLNEEATKDSSGRISKLAYNGKIQEIYQKREANLFLLGTKNSLEEVKNALKNIEVLDVNYNGLEYTIQTDKLTFEEDVVRQLLDARLGFTYFRDISGSPARLFLGE